MGAYTMAGEREEDGAMVFRPRTAAYSPVRTVVALALWLGAIHLNVLLLLASAFFFSRSTAALVIGMQLFLVFVPVKSNNRWGRIIARFICKHAVGYFPITLHIEDYGAFDPKTAYLFGYEPHCAVPLGMWALADPMSCMPLPRMKLLASSAGHAYNWWTPGSKLLVNIARAIKAPPAVFWGKFGTPIPFRSPLHVFVGRPIEVTKNDQPTMDEINDVHEQFVTALEELFNKHKNRAGYPNLKLRVM